MAERHCNLTQSHEKSPLQISFEISPEIFSHIFPNASKVGEQFIRLFIRIYFPQQSKTWHPFWKLCSDVQPQDHEKVVVSTCQQRLQNYNTNLY